jgi:TonB family protein
MIPLPSLANAAAWFAQVAVVTAAAALLPWIFRLHAPGVRYCFWRATLALCLALPWIQGRVATPAAQTASAAKPGAVAHAANAGAPHAAAAALIDWVSVLLALAAAGAIVRLAWMAVGIARLRRLRNAGEPASDCLELDELSDVIGTRADVRFVAGIQHPVTFGALRPVVLLPDSLRTRSADIRRAVLAHELLHVGRRDWAWHLAEELLRAVFWFHPAFWWLVNRVQLSREEVVDELAVIVTGRRRAYVEALLAFADRVPLAASAFARQRHLFRRMVLISREGAMSSTRIAASSIAMALLVISGSLYATSAFPLQTTAPQPRSAAGPLEQRANPVTPENPVPRRIGYVEAEMPAPAEAAGARGTISLYVTLDDSGRVAEARPIGMSMSMDNPHFNASFSGTTWGAAQGFTDRAAGGRAREPIEAMMQAAIAAVRQWQYDPPFKAPISFTVVVRFGPPPPLPPPPPPPVPASSARGGRGARMPPPPPPPPRPSGAFEVTPEPRVDSDMYEGAVRIGGDIRPPTKIRDVRPYYPPVAQQARVQGVVIVEARIERDGTVSHARVLRSIPLLDQAAIDAVMQWEFTPTLLNGVPTPVIMTVTVNFSLQ